MSFNQDSLETNSDCLWTIDEADEDVDEKMMLKVN